MYLAHADTTDSDSDSVCSDSDSDIKHMICQSTLDTQYTSVRATRLYILCWSEHTRRKLSLTLATPTTLVLTTLVAQCELSRRKIGLLLEVVGQKFSHRPGNPATVGVVRWPAAGDTAGSSLRWLSFLQHRIYNLLVSESCSSMTTSLHSNSSKPKLWYFSSKVNFSVGFNFIISITIL